MVHRQKKATKSVSTLARLSGEIIGRLQRMTLRATILPHDFPHNREIDAALMFSRRALPRHRQTFVRCPE
jgi:hypothetical protein